MFRKHVQIKEEASAKKKLVLGNVNIQVIKTSILRSTTKLKNINNLDNIRTMNYTESKQEM